MDLLLPGQTEDLAAWRTRGFSAGSEAGPSARDLELSFARELGREAPGAPAPDGPFARVARTLFAYEIFPRRLVRGVLARTPVETGDTVGISYRVGAGVRLFFAARVVDRFDTRTVREGSGGDAWRAGFTYRTLTGHPELGEETFAVMKDGASGAVSVSLRSWSRAGSWITRVGAPVMRLAQRRANEAALEHLAEVARGG